MSLKNMPGVKSTSSKVSGIIGDIEMNVKEEEKDEDILGLKGLKNDSGNSTPGYQKEESGISTPESQKAETDAFSNESNAGSHRSSDVQTNERVELISEPDIEKENSSYFLLLKKSKSLESLIKRSKEINIKKSLNEIKCKLDDINKNIKILNYIDSENKKFINTFLHNIDKIEKLLKKNEKESNNKSDTREEFETYYNSILICFSEFMEKNREDIYRIKKDKLRMKIPHEKDFNKHLEKKLDFLTERLDLLQMKYNGYKKWYDRMNISIIIVSTVLSVFESFRLEIQDLIPEDSHGLELTFNMIPIVISSGITCAAAIIKFKKYQEKMENMQFTREKVITSISRIENVKESLWFNEDRDFKNIKDNYLKEVFTTYNESKAELKRHIKFDDPRKFTKHVTEKKKENKNVYIY